MEKQIIETVKYARTHCNYYKELLNGKKIEYLEDFQKIPFLDNQTYVKNTPPNSTDLVRDGNPSGAFVFSSGGTTAKPRYIYRDFEDIDDQHEYFQGLKLNSNDKVLNLFMPGMWGVYTTSNRAISNLDCTIFPFGGSDLSEGKLQQLREMIDTFNINCLIGVPSTISRVARFLQSTPKIATKINKVYCLGEKVFDTTLEYISSVFNHVLIKSAYGCMESAAIGYQDDCVKGDEYHVFPYQYVEIVDPENGKVLPEGSYGQKNKTTLKKRLIPLLRYKTGDIGQLRNDNTGCDNNRILKVKGRGQDMLITASVHITVNEVKSILEQYEFLDSEAFQIHCKNNGDGDQVSIIVEGKNNEEKETMIKDQFIIKIDDLDEALESKKIKEFNVNIKRRGGIKRSEKTGKIKRIIDQRK